MNKTLAITAIALVAVVMGMSTLAPAAADNPLRIGLGAGCGLSAPAGTVCVAVDKDDDGECDVAVKYMKEDLALKLTGGSTCTFYANPV